MLLCSYERSNVGGPDLETLVEEDLTVARILKRRTTLRLSRNALQSQQAAHLHAVILRNCQILESTRKIMHTARIRSVKSTIPGSTPIFENGISNTAEV